MRMKQYFKNLGTSLSQFGNTLIGGNPDESLSSRSYRRGTLEGNKNWRTFGKFIDWLFFKEDNHIKNSYYRDLKYAELITERYAQLNKNYE